MMVLLMFLVLVDLEVCVCELIYFFGFIQFYGVLLVVDVLSGLVIQVSVNVFELIGLFLDQILGVLWLLLIGFDCLLEDDGMWLLYSGWVFVQFFWCELLFEVCWVVVMYCYEQYSLIELVLYVVWFDEDLLCWSYELGCQFEVDCSIDVVVVCVVCSLCNLFGYDWVMIYCFDCDWNGEVIVELLCCGLELYLGLYYLVIDILVQVCVLYLCNCVCGISDVCYMFSLIVLVDDFCIGQLLDLSDVLLCSVLLVYLEYLFNMGVIGILVVLIIVNGWLWGFIFCYYYVLCYVDYDMCELVDGVVSVLVMCIGVLLEVEKEELESSLLIVCEKLIIVFSENEQISVVCLGELVLQLLEVVDVDGVVIFVGDELIIYGYVLLLEGLVCIWIVVVLVSVDYDVISGVLYIVVLGECFLMLVDLVLKVVGIIFMLLVLDVYSVIMWMWCEMVYDVCWGGNLYLFKLEIIFGVCLLF